MQGHGGKLAFIDEAARRTTGTAVQLRERAARLESGLQVRTGQVESGLRARETRIEAGLRARGGTLPVEVATAAARGTTPDLAAMQASIRSVLSYIRQNPVPAALLALGAGVVAASMWKEQAGHGGRRSRRRR